MIFSFIKSSALTSNKPGILSFFQSGPCTLHMTSYKNKNCNDNTFFPLLGHIQWKVEVIIMVGLSEPFKLLARGEGPTESGYNYAMEKDREERNERGKYYLKEWKTALWENLALLK